MDEINKEAMNTEEPKEETYQQAGGASTIRDFDYQTYERVEEKATKTASTTALVLGICSIVFDFIFGIVGLALGIIGIIFAVKARKNEAPNGMSTAGLVCSIIGIVLGALATICFITVVVAAITEGASPYYYDYYNYF